MADCNCDFVKYSPICGEDGNTYISPCHAGCLEQNQYDNGTKYYANCRCIHPNQNESNFEIFYPEEVSGGHAASGACLVDCQYELFLFMVFTCIEKFFGSTARASNFLISLRSVKEEDKTVSMGFGVTVWCLLGFVPSPIIFGWIIDQTCTVWGKTCEGTGNCWLYDGEKLRFTMNLAAAASISIGILLDCGVWYYVKDLKIFDDEVFRDEVVNESSHITRQSTQIAYDLNDENLYYENGTQNKENV